MFKLSPMSVENVLPLWTFCDDPIFITHNLVSLLQVRNTKLQLCPVKEKKGTEVLI